MKEMVMKNQNGGNLNQENIRKHIVKEGIKEKT
jgi:hypothetical protein